MGHRRYYWRGRSRKDFHFAEESDHEDAAAKSRTTLKYLTRLLFVAILLSCLLIIVTCVLTLVHCRQTSKPIEALISSSDGHCTSLGLPAYFACVILIFSVFGFGCLGRKVTGVVLLLVSLAEMVLAVVMATKDDCPRPDAEVTATRLNLTLEQCGLLQPGPAGGPEGARVFTEERLLQQLQGRSHDTQCLDTAASFQRVCGVPRPSDPVAVLVNATVMQRCASDMADRLYGLCAQDSDLVVPILLTVPVFYVGIAVALIYIKRLDAARGEGGNSGEGTAISVGTNTDNGLQPATSWSCLACRRGLTSLCDGSLLCLECAVRGRHCACLKNSRPALTSRLSFQLKDVQGEDDVRKSILRTCSPHRQPADPNLIEDCV